MELGIGGKWAIVCASSKGLGFGCAKALALEGVNVVINSRSAESLAVAADSECLPDPESHHHGLRDHGPAAWWTP